MAINPAALLPAAAPLVSGTHSALPELAFPSSEPGRIQSLETVPTLPGSGDAGVSFDVPAQADTLHSANKVMKLPGLACLLAFFLAKQLVCFFLVRQLHIMGQFSIWKIRLILPSASALLPPP